MFVLCTLEISPLILEHVCVAELPSGAVAVNVDDVSTHTSGVSTDDLAVQQVQCLDSTKNQELQMQVKEMQEESQM